ncbi:ATP-binding protein [bacterium]|nr:ATP-binding protein [bacterium]
MNQSRPKPLVIWTGDDRLAASVGQLASAAGLLHSRHQGGTSGKADDMPVSGVDGVILADCDLGMDLMTRLAAARPAHSLVYAFGGNRRELINDVFGKLSARHVLGRNTHLLRHEMLPLVSLCAGAPGVWALLSAGSRELHAARLWDGSGIEAAVEGAKQAAAGLNTYSEFPNYVATCVWELLTNAIYDARRGTAIELRRDSKESLPGAMRTSDRLVTLEVCADEEKIAIRIQDRLGRLTPAMVLQNWTRADARAADQIKHDHGGAGVGLYMVLHECAQLIFSVQRDVSTEIVFTLPVERMNRAFLTRIPSVHFFEMGS